VVFNTHSYQIRSHAHLKYQFLSHIHLGLGFLDSQIAKTTITSVHATWVLEITSVCPKQMYVAADRFVQFRYTGTLLST
jgi:hypothetical protein